MSRRNSAEVRRISRHDPLSARSSATTLRPDTSSEITTISHTSENPSELTIVNTHQNNQHSTFSNIDLINDGDNNPENRMSKSLEDEIPVEPPPSYYKPYKHEILCQKNPGMMEHPSITFGGPMILLFDIFMPCVIYYTWYHHHESKWRAKCHEYTSVGAACPYEKTEYDKDILGYAIISFGIGELYILIARVCRLFFHRDECAPLLSRNKWELDATSWVYAVAMICALIPFVIGSADVKPKLYLYAPSFLMIFLALLMIATLLPIPLPIGINSHSRGSGLRPFIYYAAEDFIAVDGLQDREFRVRYNARYENSRMFRRLFFALTCWWIFGVCVYVTCLSAVIWKLPFHDAFGLSLGILFGYIATWAGTSVLFVFIENKREFNRAKKLGILSEEWGVENQVHTEAAAAVAATVENGSGEGTN